MSSSEVRTAINAAVATASSPILSYDLSDYVTIEECLASISTEAVLIQYVTSGERIASIGGDNNQGWEEDGSVVLHFVTPVGFESSPVISKCDSIREALRGSRLTSKLTIEACDPFTDFGAGAISLYGGAWKGYASNLYYVNRSCG